MASPEKHSKPLRQSQFNLRTVFALFFCAAIGLTIGTHPPALSEDVRSAGTIPIPAQPTDWFFALLATGSVAIAIGLVQRIRLLIETGPRIPQGYGVALRYAIVWRAVIASMIAICIVGMILNRCAGLVFPERDSYVFYGIVFPDSLWFLCVMVVLGASAAQLGAVRSSTPSRHWMTPLIWIGATIMGMLIFPSKIIIHWLVYLALSGIEKHQALRWQRPGAYSHHLAEGHWFFWASCLAVLCAVLGAASLTYFLRTPVARIRRKVLTGIASTLLLGTALGYSVWYYGWGLPREAPDFAAAGACGTWLDWCGIFAMLLILVTIGAYQIVTEKSSCIQLSNLPIAARPVLFESYLLLPCFVSSVLLFYFNEMRAAFENFAEFGFVDTAGYFLTDSGEILLLALSIVMLQFVWRRWKFRENSHGIQLIPLDGREFAVAFILLSVATAICIPTIAAFSFAYWLGPWWQ